jgi:signal transduction histidine kinase
MKNKILSPEELTTNAIALIAHQLRSSLGGISSASDLLLQGDYGKFSTGAKEMIQMIKIRSDRMLSLAETSINAARLESGVFDLRPENIDLAHEIKMILAELEPLAAEKKIKLTAQIVLPSRVFVDREILRNMIFNLTDNAIKYTARGKVSVLCRIEGDHLKFEVADTGEGLTAEEKKMLFQRFHRGRETKHKHDGVGLGLYVVKKMADAAKAQITVQSRGKNKGTTFRVLVPLKI